MAKKIRKVVHGSTHNRINRRRAEEYHNKEIKKSPWDKRSNLILMLSVLFDLPVFTTEGLSISKYFPERGATALKDQFWKIASGYTDKGKRRRHTCDLGLCRKDMPFTHQDYRVIAIAAKHDVPAGDIAKMLGRKKSRIEWELMHLTKTRGLPEFGEMIRPPESARELYLKLKECSVALKPDEVYEVSILIGQIVEGAGHEPIRISRSSSHPSLPGED